LSAIFNNLDQDNLDCYIKANIFKLILSENKNCFVIKYTNLDFCHEILRVC